MTSRNTTPQQSMQRVKVGMIGLALVVLLIGLASAIFAAANRERPVEAAGAGKADTVANLTIANTTEPAAAEPLAELGVAPSATDGNTGAPAAKGTRR